MAFTGGTLNLLMLSKGLMTEIFLKAKDD